MRRSLVLDVWTRIVVCSALVVSVYLLAAGHNQPGGGFIGGLVAGAALAMAYVAGGLDQVRALTRFQPWTILGGGLVLATTSAIVPLVLGGDVLEQGYTTLTLPLFGDVKVTSALVFDSGVYAVVLGTVFMAFEALGEEEPPGDAVSTDRGTTEP